MLKTVLCPDSPGNVTAESGSTTSLSGFSVFIWDSLLHVTSLKAKLSWTSVHLQSPSRFKSQIQVPVNAPFSGSLGVDAVRGAGLGCSLLVRLRETQCEGAAPPFLA